MRKIEQWMIETIRKQQSAATLQSVGYVDSKINDNTWVRTSVRSDMEIVTTVYLHGNLIAQYSNGKWGFKMCGWNTPTTRSRINAIAHEWRRAGVCMRKGVLYSGGEVITSVDWF